MNKIYCIGIGGIGVSALARYYAAKGWQVSGSDRAASELTDDLQKEGINVAIGHSASNIPRGVAVVVYSAAVQEENPELRDARGKGVLVMSYAEALGAVTKQYITIAVSGAHGKSTTTALLSLMLIKAGLDPTVIIGTRLAEFGGKNFRAGQSRYLVIEADEWNRSFLHYSPAVAVITNVDKEHLDTYKSINGVVAAFRAYLRQLPPAALAIINRQDANSARAAKGCACRVEFFNPAPKPAMHYGIQVKAGTVRGNPLLRWPLQIPGHFNQLNGEAAWRAARELGVSRQAAVSAVKGYRGSWRRMERLTPHTFSEKEMPRGIFFSDYAHHPTEIRATITALREQYPRRRLLVVFQPHQRERLTNLFNDFVKAFAGASQIALLPVYEVAGRESGSGKTSEDLYRAIRQKYPAQEVSYLKKFEDAFKLIRGQAVVFMGAGNIDDSARKYFQSTIFS